MNGLSRGDLGFIPSQRASASTRSFFGATGHPSKKGVTAHVARVPMMDRDTAMLSSGDVMLEKRTDWLESQERKLTATVSKHQGDYQDIAEQFARQAEEAAATARQQAEQLRVIFDSSQTTYGKAATKIVGLPCSLDDTASSLAAYAADPKCERHEPVCGAGEWLLLSYPMKRVLIDGGDEVYMLSKKVHPRTGQIALQWALLYRTTSESATEMIERFSILPS